VLLLLTALLCWGVAGSLSIPYPLPVGDSVCQAFAYGTFVTTQAQVSGVLLASPPQ
jgi:hypothetical protein